MPGIRIESECRTFQAGRRARVDKRDRGLSRIGLGNSADSGKDPLALR